MLILDALKRDLVDSFKKVVGATEKEGDAGSLAT
jgi:hypothetical protein